MDEIYLNIRKSVYGKHIANMILMDKNPQRYPIKVRNNKGLPLPPLLFNTALEALARAIREEKKSNGIRTKNI